jgi:hypothetical protein
MKLFLDTGRPTSTTLPPCTELKQILNEDECQVWSVEITFGGRLFYRNKGSLKRSYEIAEVRFINSYVDKTFAPEWSVHADFDIITTDGRVIEVATWHRKIIEAALRLTVKPDPRAGVRAARRLQNAR